MAAKKTKKTKLKKILISVSFALLALIALLIFAFTWRGSTREIEAVANSFTPPQGWTQIDERVEPPRFVCLMGNCPEVIRKWSYDGIVTSIEMRFLVSAMNPTEIIMDECIINIGASSTTYSSCSGVKDGYKFTFFYGKEKKDASTTISLTIRKR